MANKREIKIAINGEVSSGLNKATRLTIMRLDAISKKAE